MSVPYQPLAVVLPLRLSELEVEVVRDVHSWLPPGLLLKRLQVHLKHRPARHPQHPWPALLTIQAPEHAPCQLCQLLATGTYRA